MRAGSYGAVERLRAEQGAAGVADMLMQFRRRAARIPHMRAGSYGAVERLTRACLEGRGGRGGHAGTIARRTCWSNFSGAPRAYAACEPATTARCSSRLAM